MAVLAGKLEARRQDCAPVAGKSTLNRLELSCLEPTRYHKISHNPVAIKGLFVDLFLEAHDRAPNVKHARGQPNRGTDGSGFFVPQTPFTHALPEVQSPSPPHACLQVPAPQA